MSIAFLALASAGCLTSGGELHAPSSEGAPEKSALLEAKHAPSNTGLSFRFIDRLANATVTGPSLRSAWEQLDYPAKMVAPYSGLDGDRAYRLINLALPDADVKSYGQPRPLRERRPASSVRFDPVWNRSHAVYESKSALLAPAETTYRFQSSFHGSLRTYVATPPQGASVSFAVLADGKQILSQQIDANSSGQWLELRSPPLEAKEIAFVTHGETGAVGFWGVPELIEKTNEELPPNLVFIVIDTLRADAFSTMPRLRQLADQGVWFDQAITAATWTRPSLLSMFGGGLSTEVGQSAETMIPTDQERRRFYAVAPKLLPRILSERGYHTTALGNNFFLLGYPQIGLDLGFDEVNDVRHPVLDTPAISAAARAFFAAHHDESFFLYLHYDAPHWPYTPPPRYLKHIRVPEGFATDGQASAYLAETAYADEYVGQVFDALESQELRDRTLVVVVGDHGEIFDVKHSHEVEALKQPTLHHHGWSAYDEILRVPLVFSLPGKISPAISHMQVSLADVRATVLDLLGVETSPRSLVSCFHSSCEERDAFTEGQNVRALRAGGWLYLRRTDGRLRLPDGTEVESFEELYDLAKDPLQHHDLSKSHLKELVHMRKRFAEATPTRREAALPVYHLRMAADHRAHLLTGLIHSVGDLQIRSVSSADVEPVDPHTVSLRLSGAAGIDFTVDPPSATVDLEISRDGIEVTAGEILTGPFAIPLLGGRKIHLGGEALTWLDAARPPVVGSDGAVLIWRDKSQLATPILAAENSANSEVSGMMQRWGYAQPTAPKSH